MNLDILSLIVANTVSGAAVTAMVFAVWQLKQRSVEAAARKSELRFRTSRIKLLQAELDTIVSFTEKCEMASQTHEQFVTYQQWLVANGLLSWKQNRHIVHTWQQTSGAALSIKLGQIAIAPDIISDLASDMRKTDFPTPEDDDFRWQEKPAPAPAE